MENVARLSSILGCTIPSNTYQEIVSSLLEKVQNQETGNFQQFFDAVEHNLIFGTRELQDTMLVDLLEELKNQASLRDIDYAIFENWLGPETHTAWRWLEKRWQGKTSLRDTASGL